jgi:hypothetical protein
MVLIIGIILSIAEKPSRLKIDEKEFAIREEPSGKQLRRLRNMLAC